MSRILLVDTNVSSSPIYNFLIQEGNEVYVVGANPNDFLAKTAKNYINIDYSNLEAMLGLIEEIGIDFLVPGCNDQSYKVCAEINAKHIFCGIDTISTTETINNKEKFRIFATENDLPVPQFFTPNTTIANRPVIVKPVDAFSGRGITVVYQNGQDSLDAAIKKAQSFSKERSCVVEEYVTGQLYSHSAFISGREILVDFIVEEHGTANQFAVDTSRVIRDFNPKILEKIRLAVTRMAKKLSLVDGLLHTQFLLNGNDYWLVEITRRCPGDLYSQLIEFSTGLKYAEMYAQPFLNQALNKNLAHTKSEWVVRHTISQSSESSLGSVGFNIPIKILNFIPLAVAGDLIKPSPFSRIGILFTKADSKMEQDILFSETLNRRLYTIY